MFRTIIKNEFDYRKDTVKKLSNRTGINQIQLYRYFNNKADLSSKNIVKIFKDYKFRVVRDIYNSEP